MASTYYDYDYYPEPIIPAQPTAEEASKAVQEMMTDLEQQKGVEDRIFCFIVLGGYIIKSFEAQRYLQAEPAIGNRIREYTDEYLRSQVQLCGILFDVSALLTRLGFA